MSDRPAGSAAHDDGFAATDALVALLILSTTLALALSGVTTARHLSELASQTSEAARVAQILMLRPSDGEGRQGRFVWRLSSSPLSSSSSLCTRDLVLESPDRRHYRFSSAGRCG